MNPITLRDETPADVGAIHDITVAAFAPLDLSGHTEQFVVQALRAAHALTLSLVAEVDGLPVGHIAFSPVTLSDGTPDWYGLGPVSVLPSHQRRGIGKALIQEGLARLKALHARGCCLVGHPAYYRRFGFENTPDLSLDGVPAEVFFALSFDGCMPRGTVTFHPAFMATGPVLNVRPFRPGDEIAICDIYNPYITGSTATFEEVPLQPAQMRERIDHYRAHHPWLVCEDAGQIVGYSYARPYHERAAYRHTVEVSVYIRQGHGRRGIGRLLYTPLIEQLQASGCHALLAVISLPNEASVALHESLGFVKVGHLREVGRKFDRWLDIGHWQSLL